MTKRTKLITLIFILVVVCLISTYYLLGYGAIGITTSNEDCNNIEKERMEYAIKYIKNAKYNQIAVKNMSHFEEFSKFIFDNEEVILKYHNNEGKNLEHPACSDDIKYFPKMLRKKAQLIWKKCKINKISFTISPQEVVFRINPCGYHFYYSTAYDEIHITKNRLKKPIINQFGKFFLYKPNVFYQIQITFGYIEGCNE